MVHGAEEIVVPFHAARAVMGMVRQVRSTLLASSVSAVRARGRYEEYVGFLDPKYKDAVLSTVAGVWLPLEVAMAHYDACDKLGYAANEQAEMGRVVSDKVHGTFLGMMVRLAAGTGLSPWTALAQSERLRHRLFVGGGVAVYKLAEKEARAEVVGLPLLASPYFRNAMRGIFQGGCELFCKRAYVHEVPKTGTPSTITLKISWA
jgi:hypothetical protein